MAAPKCRPALRSAPPERNPPGRRPAFLLTAHRYRPIARAPARHAFSRPPRFFPAISTRCRHAQHHLEIRLYVSADLVDAGHRRARIATALPARLRRELPYRSARRQDRGALAALTHPVAQLPGLRASDRLLARKFSPRAR